MQAVWIDEGTTLNAAKLRQHNITAPYFSHRFGNATKEILDAAKGQGFQPGIYSAWNWEPAMDGTQYAAFLSGELKRIGGLALRGATPVCVDIETHDVAYILAFFKEWRRLRPTRVTAWTMEGFQGGLFSPANVAELVSRNIRFVPQFYGGAVEPLQHSPVIDMLIQGFPGDRIDGFYDARALPYRWRGFAFTQATLP